MRIKAHHKLLNTSDEIRTLAETLKSQPMIALDTEFLRERTYRAELCLVQVYAESDAQCVDPLALSDLTPLAGAALLVLPGEADIVAMAGELA